MTSNAGCALNFALTDYRAKELFYRLDGQGDFKSTGHQPFQNPQTGLPMVNLHLPLPNLTPGEHTLEVRYTHAKGTTNGPYALKFSTGDQQLAQGEMMLNAADIVSVARQHVDALVARLPADLQREARSVEWEFRARCDDPDPNAQDTMGGYSRSARRIRLYLHAIAEYCWAEGADYVREIETTFLHELGHHLGLEEDALESRGL